jgi:hypothetical protein
MVEQRTHLDHLHAGEADVPRQTPDGAERLA